MRIKIVGKVRRKGTSKKTGTDYDFIELHYVAPAYGVIGEEAATTTIDPDTYPFDKIVPGAYHAEFDSHGRILTLAPIQSTPMERYSYTGVYRVTDYAHPFDAYQGEDVLLLDEYNSNFKIRDLLNYLDGYPLTLPARYSNRVACYTKVYIVSNLCLSKQYPDEQYNSPATFDALLRRIGKVVQYTGPGQCVEFDTVEYMQNPFLGGSR